MTAGTGKGKSSPDLRKRRRKQARGPERLPIAVVGAFDTKGEDLSFMQRAVTEQGYPTLAVDTSVIGTHNFPVDITADRVADAGGETLGSLRGRGDRGHAMAVMRKGPSSILRE